MSRTVFILGAGASVEAGAPVMANFLDRADESRHTIPGTKPLDKIQQDNFDLVFRGLAALRAAHSKAELDVDNLESVFGAFEMARLAGRLPGLSVEEVARLNPAMRALIVTTLERSIQLLAVNRAVHAPEPYEDFIQLAFRVSGSPLGPVSFITFNYDLALDFALFRYRQDIDYCFTEQSQRGIPVMKLHGSVNWARCTGCKTITPWTLPEFFKDRSWTIWEETARPVSLLMGPELPKYKHCPDMPCEGDPIIVPPTWNKAEYQQVANVWKHAARHLSDAENIIVIGYSLPESDQFFRYLFAVGTIGEARPQRFWVVDPDPDGRVAERFRKLLGPAFESRFRPFRTTFSLGIGQIADALPLPARD
jgi:NAD-dependent SIR2 family protein deacetylase